MIWENILIYFVVIPVLMLASLALSKRMAVIRTICVVGATALLALSAVVTYQFLALREAVTRLRCSLQVLGCGLSLSTSISPSVWMESRL